MQQVTLRGGWWHPIAYWTIFVIVVAPPATLAITWLTLSVFCIVSVWSHVQDMILRVGASSATAAIMLCMTFPVSALGASMVSLIRARFLKAPTLDGWEHRTKPELESEQNS